MPFPSITGFSEPARLEAGDLAIKGDIEVDAFDNVARFTGLSTGIFSNMPGDTFFGNLYSVEGPGRAFPANRVAGSGLAYSTSIENGPFPEIVFQGAQSFPTAATTHTIDLPPRILERHRILIGTYHNEAAQSVTTPTGFTLLGKVETTAGEVNVFERIYDGTSSDPQTELDIDCSVSSSLLVYVWHLRFCHGSHASEVVTQLANNASDTSNDLGNLTPSWSGSGVNALWLLFIGIEEDVAAPNITAFPNLFIGTGQEQIVSATAAVDGAIGWAHRFLGTTSLNPGAFTYGPARSGAFLIAVPPDVAGRLDVGASTSIITTNDTVERAALTGAIAAAQNSNATLFSGIRVGGAATTDRTNINFIAGTGIALTPTDDAVNDEIEITISTSGGAGSQGWDDTLAIDFHSGANNPFVDTSQHINFGTTAATQVTGQIRSSNAFHVNVDQTMELESHDSIHMHCPDAITIESTSGSTVQMLSSSIVRLRSTASSVELVTDAGDVVVTASSDFLVTAGATVDLQSQGDLFLESVTADINLDTPAGSMHFTALTDINMSASVVRVGNFMRMPEQAASTPAVGAGFGLWWTRNTVPSRPYFTDDTDVDFQIALLPIALTDIATIADDTFLGNISGGAAAPSAITFTSFAGDGLAYDATNHQWDVVGSTSITITSDQVQRAALTGAIAASANNNATLFAGIRDNGAAETDRTNLNFVNGTNTTVVVTDDGVNDELEIAVSVDNFPLSGLADQADDTFLVNIAGAAAPPTAQTLASFAGDGLTYDATNHQWDVVGSTSITITSDQVQRAALTGAIAASANSNATLFAGIRDNGAAETDRTNLNFINGTNTTVAITDDGVNDELEIAVSVDNFPLTGLADQAAETFLGNFTAGAAPPTARAGTSVAGAGLTYTAGGTLAVGQGTYITVNADDVAVNRVALSADLDSASVINNAGVLERAALTGAIVATQNSNATLFGGILDNGVAENNRTNLNFLSSTSVTAAITDDSVNDELEIVFQRAALTGAIAASANSNATLFSGIRDNGAAETDRTNLNFVNGTNTTIAVTDDAGNDELEIAVSVDNFPLTGLADQAANTVVVNATAGAAPPTALAMGTNTFLARHTGNIEARGLGTLAGQGLFYNATDGTLNVNAHSDYDMFIDGTLDAVGFRKTNRRLIWWEDFDSVSQQTTAAGGNNVVPCGQGNWSLEAVTGAAVATCTNTNAVANHPGIINIATSATNGHDAHLHKGFLGPGGATGLASILANQIYEIEAVIRLPTVTSILFQFGWRDSASDNMIIFVGDTAAGVTNIRAYAEEANVATGTDVDTGVAMVANAWNVYTIRQESLGTVDYYIDGVLEATNAANIPDTETGSVYFAIFTRTAASRSMDIDYVHFESQLITARTS